MNVSAGKVGYLDTAVPVEEDVGRFEVAVYDTVIMKVIKSRCLHSIKGEPVGGERKGQWRKGGKVLTTWVIQGFEKSCRIVSVTSTRSRVSTCAKLQRITGYGIRLSKPVAKRGGQ